VAINSVVLDMLARLAGRKPGPKRLLCLGYPDMLVTEPQLAKVLGEEAAARLAFRDDSAAILDWHGLQAQMSRMAETESVFRALGIETDFVDIVASRGKEIVLDLNEPAPDELLGRYDLVYDGGTTEHCFNVAQVMRNILGFAKVGGYILHVNPFNYYNHGFFNFNPTFYHDWYSQNGHGLVAPCCLLFGPVLESTVFSVDPVRPFREAPARAVNAVAAQKLSDTPAHWPMQSKYQANPSLKKE
jgi:hypothetical protein